MRRGLMCYAEHMTGPGPREKKKKKLAIKVMVTLFFVKCSNSIGTDPRLLLWNSTSTAQQKQKQQQQQQQEEKGTVCL